MYAFRWGSHDGYMEVKEKLSGVASLSTRALRDQAQAVGTIQQVPLPEELSYQLWGKNSRLKMGLFFF